MKENNNVVYKISFVGTDLFYIGSAISFKNRRRQHLSELRGNRHRNSILQRCFNKYYESETVFTILESNSENLVAAEQKYIDLLNPQINLCRKAYSCAGLKQTPELIEKRIRKIRGRRKYSFLCAACNCAFKTSEKTRKFCGVACKNKSQMGRASWNAGVAMVHSGSFRPGHRQSNTGRTHFKPTVTHA